MIKRSLLLSLMLVAGGLHAQNQEQPIDLAKAKETAETICVGCHTADGNSQIPSYPKLAGQIPEYMFKQLKQFKSWHDQPAVRENMIMAPMAGLFEEADMRSLAYYFASQQQIPAEAEDRPDLVQGRNIWRGGIAKKGIPSCSACHGPTGAGIPAEYPRLSGQHSEYLLIQLQNFREDLRKNDNNEVMRMIALKMTDAEMKAVANYASGLR